VHGCNLTMSRSVVELVGCFDTSLGAGQPIGAAEDTDFVYRAYRAGVPVLYNPSIVVFHYHGRRDLVRIRKLQKVYDISDGAILRKAWIFRLETVASCSSQHPRRSTRISRRSPRQRGNWTQPLRDSLAQPAWRSNVLAWSQTLGSREFKLQVPDTERFLMRAISKWKRVRSTWSEPVAHSTWRP
jgi:hypothetical protein